MLGEKFDELNSRYLQREQQMETLLNRLSVRTGAGIGIASLVTNSSSPRAFRVAKSDNKGIGQLGSSSSSSSPDLDLRQLSPSLSVHLFAAASDFPEV